MFAIDEEKLPPPTPAAAAQASRTQNCVSWLWEASQPLGTTTASRVAGMSSRLALIVVHTRPPKRGTANVYGMRRVEPIRFGTAVNQNCSGSDSVMPTFPRFRTMMVHRTQIEKPRCSAKMEKARFLRAIRRPVFSQNRSSSGSQCVIGALGMRREARSPLGRAVCPRGRVLAHDFPPPVDG